MKKNIKLFILAIGFMILFGVENVFANEYYNIEYQGCKDIELPTQVIQIGQPEKTYECKDKDFMGWYVQVISSNKNGSGWYCLDDDGKDLHSDCTQGFKIYGNGFSSSQTGNAGDTVKLHAINSSTVQKFTVKFDSGITEGVTGSMDDIEVAIGFSTKLPANQYKREGYTFAGWEARIGDLFMCEDGNLDKRDNCKGSHGGVKKYPDGASISQTGTPGSTVAFIATWKSDSSGSSTVDKKCSEINDSQECVNNKCSWNKDYNFCSKDGLAYLSCGDANDIPAMVPDLISKGVTILKTITPIVLIIMAIIQLVKAIMGSKEEDIKKAQASLFKKAIAAALVFFVITIVQFIMLKAADSSEKNSLSDCLSCFLNGTSDEKCNSIYYKDGEDTIKVSK